MTRIRFALLGVLLLTQGCTTVPIAASDRDLTVSEGSTFQVVLDGPPGTGFPWTVDGVQTGTVELIRREPPGNSSMGDPGSVIPGTRQTFVFLARRSGTVTLHFTYGGAWAEKSPPPFHSYRVQVVRC